MRGRSSAPTVAVVGAGVIGMTAALRLAEAGHRLCWVARERPEATTSAVAAAVWYPYLAEPRARVVPWSAETLRVCGELAEVPGSGVRFLRVLELFLNPAPDPWWGDAVPGWSWAGEEARPPGFAAAVEARVPVIDSSRHLRWLETRLRALGVELEVREVTDLAALDAAVVVDAAGLGARDLACDPTLRPVRGQVVRVADPGLDTVLLDQDDAERMTYVIPRGHDCILGGTSEPGNASLAPDPATTAAILDRARRLEPRLRGAEPLEVKVGLRPARPAVRLDVERRDGVAIVHCYGHGGAGYTLAWGCAAEVAALVATVTGPPASNPDRRSAADGDRPSPPDS